MLSGLGCDAVLSVQIHIPDAIYVCRYCMPSPGALDTHVPGAVHCDVHPGNVLVGGTPPRVQLVDFGLSLPLGVAIGNLFDLLHFIHFIHFIHYGPSAR